MQETIQQLSAKVKLNIDWARRNLTEMIYDQAILEGVATTRADTEAIIIGGLVQNMTAEDIVKTRNLKRAWDFILTPETLWSPTDFALLSQINRLVEETFYYTAGQVRTVPVTIGGTTWQPPIPIESQIKEELIAWQQRATVKKPIEAAIDLLLYVMRRQIFLDGNKRTAVLTANHYLIARAAGLMVISETLVADFKKLLVAYYESGDETVIGEFLRRRCWQKMSSA